MKIRSLIIYSLLLNLAACSNFEYSDEKKELGYLTELSLYSHISINDRAYLLGVSEVNERSNIMESEFNFKTLKPIGINEAIAELAKSLNTNYFFESMDKSSTIKTENRDFKIQIEFNGTAQEYLDFISKSYDVFVSVDDAGDIEVKYYDSKIYSLSVFSDQFTSESEFNLSQEEGGTLASTNKITNKGEFWGSVRPFMDDFMGDGKYAILSDQSSILILERPSRHKKISSVLDLLEDLSTKQISLDYVIFEFDIKEVEELAAGVNLTKVGGENLVSSFLNFDDLNGSISGGSNGVGYGLQALIALNNTHLVSKGSLKTLSNRAVPLNIQTDTAYVSSTERTTGSNDDDSFSSIEADTVKSGLTIMFQPQVLADERIKLDGGFSKKTLVRISEFKEQVQLPEVSSTETFSTNILDQGKYTLIYSFLENSQVNENNAGLLGFSENNENKKKIIAVFVKAITS
ncbi:hypothetical protein [Vibrio splendidus]|uniref:hypothetical protein n=1 Tax=Vibrio splendidus TaxID=29497 RepID=UPI0021B1C169|nr:hypothetical protein [Vibrio splendidus]UWZ98591.1 hypothetical protein IM698_04340 [Vibrio splendidus]